ncbi:hypothetical protein BGZ60DRAFT_566817 [Tricladium varicosporioides]|nr:hypothetical protein BGZ60DRAFT_566817 [Hymenoscyphus varicosporioides]
MLSGTRPILHSLQSGCTPYAAAGVLASIGLITFYSRSNSPLTPTANSVSTIERPKTFRGGPAFTSLTLDSIEKLNHDTSRFRFKLPTPEHVSGLSLTSAILTVTRPGGWKPVIRPYTPTSDLSEPSFLDLTIKRYPNGQASTHIHNLQPGDSLFVLAALRAYPWKQNEFRHVTMIAGGAGITPIVQLIRGIFTNPDEKTKVTLLFGVNRDEDALFKDEFNKYQEQYPDRFKVVYTVTNPEPNSEFRRGRISKELIKETLGEEGVGGKVFLCGPPAMEEAMMGSRRGGNKGVLGELGVERRQIFRF